MKEVPKILTIGGSDSSGCSGIQSDVRTVTALGGHALVAVTAVTAQKTNRVEHIHEVPAESIRHQIRAALETGPGAAKTGMLPSPAAVEAIADTLEDRHLPLVVDPVFESSSGQRLVDAAVPETIAACLLPLASLVTPNLSEAACLAGLSPGVRDLSRTSARAIFDLTGTAVLVTGGHAGELKYVIDVLFDGTHFTEIGGPRVRTANSRGTGCTLSSAITLFLASGLSLLESCRRAREVVEKGLRASFPLDAGGGPLKIEVSREPHHEAKSKCP